MNDTKPDKSLESLADAYRKLSPYLNIGYVWAISVIAFTLLGRYLDRVLGTHPWLTVAGAVIGIVAGFYHFIKTVLHEEEKNNT